jgi:hypothetical protein
VSVDSWRGEAGGQAERAMEVEGREHAFSRRVCPVGGTRVGGFYRFRGQRRRGEIVPGVNVRVAGWRDWKSFFKADLKVP